MLRQQFIQEIDSANLMLHASGYQSIDYVYNAIQKGIFVPEIITQPIVSTKGESYIENNDIKNPFNAWQDDSIAIIPLEGIMLKNSYWWYGVDDIANIISLAYDSDKITGVILKANTPGGNTDSLFLLQQILSKKTKPTYGFIDGMCCSCGYIAFSYMDKIYSINRMAQVGGIGVFARIMIPNNKDNSYKVKEVYPKESPEKNIEERELLKGNDDPFKEKLSKVAVYFQELIKANRPSVAAKTLAGMTYFSYEAQPLGMIDGICSLDDVVSEMTALNENRKKVLTYL